MSCFHLLSAESYDTIFREKKQARAEVAFFRLRCYNIVSKGE